MKKPVLMFIGTFSLLTVTFGLSGVCHAGSNQSLPNSALQMDVRLSKETYVVGEPIVAAINLKNNGATSVSGVWFSYGSGFYIDIRTAKRKTRVKLNGIETERQHLITSWQTSVAPSASVRTALDIVTGDVLNVDPYFLRAENQQGEAITGYIIQPGLYVLVAIQDVKDSSGSLTRLTAEARFRVRQPDKTETAALMLMGHRPIVSNEPLMQPKDAETAALATALASFLRVVTSYPHTPYAPYAMHYSGRTLQTMGKVSQAARVYQKLLRKYPDFPLQADALYFLADTSLRAGDLSGANKAVKSLQTKYSNFLLAPVIRYLEAQTRLQQLEQQASVANVPRR